MHAIIDELREMDGRPGRRATAMKYRACLLFADFNGLLYTGSFNAADFGWPCQSICIDHPDYFIDVRTNIPVIMVVHNYQHDPQLSHDWFVEESTIDSWYYPGEARMFGITRDGRGIRWWHQARALNQSGSF